MCTLAVVRHLDDLVRAANDLAGFFRERSRRDENCLPPPLLAAWIDPAMVGESTTSLAVSDPDHGTDPVPICESVGVYGVWTLWWLQRKVPRSWLVDALRDASQIDSGDQNSTGFIPVFPRSAAEDAVQAEVVRLQARHPALVLGPWYQHPLTGRFSPDRR